MIAVGQDGLKAEVAIERDRFLELRQGVELDLAIAETGRFGENGGDERPAETGAPARSPGSAGAMVKGRIISLPIDCGP